MKEKKIQDIIWYSFFVVFCISAMVFSGKAKGEDNIKNLKIATKELSKEFIKEIAPDIKVPEYLKKYKLPESISFSNIDEMHYNNDGGNTYTIDPFNPIDKVQYEFGEDKNKSITYDNDGNITFQFKKSFNWK